MEKSDIKLKEELPVDFWLKYPTPVQTKLLFLRKIILESAAEIEVLEGLEETLKWGEPSYIAKHGSTLRIDWKEKSPDQYAIYFKCTSKLVHTFKEVFGDLFNYETTRAIVFKLEDEVPIEATKACIKAALVYHKVKKMPHLNIEV